MFSDSLRRSLALFIFMFSMAVLSMTVGAAPSSVMLLNKSKAGELNIEAKKVLSPRVSARLSLFEGRESYQQFKKYSSLSVHSYQQTSILVLDFHPFGNAFRTSFGAAIKHHRWNIRVAPDVNYQPEAIRFDVNRERLSRYLGSEDYVLEWEEYHLYGQYRVGAWDIEIDEVIRERRYVLENSTLDDVPSAYVLELPAINIDERDINVAAELKFRRYAPYMGFGWGAQTRLNAHSDSWFLYSVDVGLIYHGKPTLDLEVGGRVMEVHYLLTEYLDRLALEQEVKINQDISGFQFMPYLSFAMQLQF